MPQPEGQLSSGDRQGDQWGDDAGGNLNVAADVSGRKIRRFHGKKVWGE
jgi:hypothetical protein